ncbi:MAG: hypothetical protein QN189_05295 [Armatimonadota bacterium]|nr:hypothetical protein [Armatimonadota bacterium]
MKPLRVKVFLVFLLVTLLLPSALAQLTVTVRDIVQNPDRYDGQIVSVTGTIAAYRERISARGNPYTTFRLEEGGASVAVFAWRHQGLRNGLRVRVVGRFDKMKRVGQYTFYNEIEAQRIEVLR